MVDPRFGRAAATALIFFTLEGSVFRTGVYRSVLDPDSAAGTVLGYLDSERARAKRGKQILVIGDSRTGFLARAANRPAPETGFTFGSIVVPGTTLRAWYYMLREVDPHANRYAAIVLPTENYEDEDYSDQAEMADVHYLAALVPLAGLPAYALSFPTWERRWEAFLGGLLKGYAYRRDFQDFLVHHKARMRRIATVRAGFARWIYDAEWGTASLAGLRVDWTARKITFPEGVTPRMRQLIEERLLRPDPPPTGEQAAYRRLWFGRIIDRYRGSPTRLVFICLPRGPVVAPPSPIQRTSTIREFARFPHVILAPEHLFDELEMPALFGDPMHLNGAGGDRFSTILAREVPRLLARPR